MTDLETTSHLPSRHRLSRGSTWATSSQRLPPSVAAIGSWEVDLTSTLDFANFTPLNYSTGEVYDIGPRICINGTLVHGPTKADEKDQMQATGDFNGVFVATGARGKSRSENGVNVASDVQLGIKLIVLSKRPSPEMRDLLGDLFRPASPVSTIAAFAKNLSGSVFINPHLASMQKLKQNSDKAVVLTQIGSVVSSGTAHLNFSIPEIGEEFHGAAVMVKGLIPDIVFGADFISSLPKKLQDHEYFKGRFQSLGASALPESIPRSPDVRLAYKTALLAESGDVFATSFRVNHDVPFEHEINILPGSTLPRSSCESIGQKANAKMSKIIKDWLQRGIISRSKSQFSSPARIAKSQGGEKTLTVDYSELNRITMKDRWPIPLIEELLDETLGAKIFSKLDFDHGYHQIPLRKEDIPKTAFITPSGLYEFNVLPYGLVNAAATFQRTMNQVLNGINGKFAVVYLGSILVYSETAEQHQQHLKEVLGRLAESHLVLKETNCSLFCDQLTYLGHRISANGLQIKEDALKTIIEWPHVRDRQSCRQFIGLCNYYRRFIGQFAWLSYPLFQFSAGKILYSHDLEESRKTLQRYVSKDPVLVIPDSRNIFKLLLRNAPGALGATLTQFNQDKKVYGIVGYFSTRQKPSEHNLSRIENLFLAACKALEYWHYYFECALQPVLISLPHSLFFQMKKLVPNETGRLLEYIDRIAAFNIALQFETHRHDTDNPSRPIYLSRGNLLTYIASLKWGVPSYKQTTESSFDCAWQLIKSPEVRQLQARIDTDPELGLIKAIISVKSRAYVPRHLKECLDHYKVLDGLLLHSEQGNWASICVVDDKERAWLVQRAYDQGICDAEGVMERLSGKVYWPNMHETIERTLKSLSEVESAETAPDLVMQPYEDPSPWKSVTMYFASQPTSELYNQLWIVVDRLTKEAHFIPCRKDDSFDSLALKFVEVVVAAHGIPHEIASNRDASFINSFWKALTSELGVYMKFNAINIIRDNNAQVRTDRAVFKKIYGSYPFRAYSNWHVILPLTEKAYNASRCANHSKTQPANLEVVDLLGEKKANKFTRHLSNKLRKFDANTTTN